MSPEPSRFMQEVIALRRLRDEVEKYMHNHMNDKDIKPVMRAYNEARRLCKK